MAKDLNEENLKEAFFKVLVCTSIGQAESSKREELLNVNVKKSVPESMHESYSSKLLGCAIKICVDNPYVWQVTHKEPTISENTTFGTLYESWFIRIVWPIN